MSNADRLNAPPADSRLVLYWRLVRMHKPIGILLLLWPTLWGLLCASHGEPDGYSLFAFITGTVLMRSAGCAINDYADREFDRHVKRTCMRPLTAGLIEPREAVAVFMVLTLLSALLVIPMNRLAWLLACAAAFLAATYPFTKRFFALPQAYLGVAFGFGIPMAYAAIQGQVTATAGVLLAANVAWALAYDTEYAMVDRDDDLQLGIRTSAITFGRWDVAAVMAFYALALALLALAGTLEALGPFYYAGLVAAGGVAAYHFLLIRGRSRDGCYHAFNHNNWFGAAVCAGLLLEYWVP